MTALTFLGTGNFLAQDRWWNSFVVDGSVLVEPSPSCLPQLRRAGLSVDGIDHVLVSHFHPDHTFGWPFLVLELIEAERPPDRPLHVVGPPGIAAYFDAMMRLGSVSQLHDELFAGSDVRFVEVDGTWQDVDGLRLRSVEVVHVADLECVGFLLDRGGVVVGYSGDTKPCPGVDELAGEADVLVLECNGAHEAKSHMDVGAVASLHERFPATRILLTHVGRDVVPPEGVELPDDLQVVEL